MASDVEPMLAGAGVPVTVEGWAAEPKLDGWRARVLVDSGSVTVRTRRGRNLDSAVAGTSQLADNFCQLVLDGELIARSGRAVDFALLGPLLASSRRQPVAATFCAFDLLWIDGELLVDRPYQERRTILEALELPVEISVVPRYDGIDAAHLLRACEDQGVEGVVLKRLDSRYRPGQRSKDWRKVKCADWKILHSEKRPPR